VGTLTIGGLTFDVLAFDFGIANTVGGAGGGGSGKASVTNVALDLVPSLGSATLVKDVLTGVHLASYELKLVPPGGGAPVAFAKFTEGFVLSAASGASGGVAVDSFELDYAKVQLVAGGQTTTFDRRTNIGTDCRNLPTVPGPPVHIPPFVAAAPLWPIAPGAVRSDAVSVLISNSVGAGGGGAGKSSLDAMTLSGPLDGAGICAFGATAVGTHQDDVELGIASPLSGALAMPLVATTWSACAPFVSEVTFRSTATPGKVTQAIAFDAPAIVDTERTFDPVTGAVTGTSVAGYDFKTAVTITSCP
jgi:type VI protein secretion system component Hcp